MRTIATIATQICTLSLCAAASQAALSDLTADWSDASNPNVVWSYNEGANPLPQVSNWQSASTSWNQPGWARSENGTNRLPFWFQSNGTEPFTHDWAAGDIVVHTTDTANGVGNGFANVTWTSPLAGTADISGAVWMGREIARSNHWRLLINNITVSEGDIADGDVYSSASPFDLATGTGGAGALSNVAVSIGTVIALQLENTSSFGDFVGVQFTVNAVPEPTSIAIIAGCLAPLVLRRRRTA